MKILIAGSDEVWSLEKYFVKHLINAGVQIQICAVQSIFLSSYNKSILTKILHKAGWSSIYKQIEEKVKQAITNGQPDVMWVFKGMELSPELLQWVKSKGVKLVNFNPDNPFIFSGSGSGNKNVTDSIGLFDLHWTYDRDIQKQIIDNYKVPCNILPFGYEISDGIYEECIKQEETVKVCFLGNPDSQRAGFIQQLAQKIPVDVYGHNWNRFLNHKNVAVFQPVYADDFWKTLYRYRVQLNLMRPHNPNSHNMRSFEVPGIGGIGLFPHTPDHATYFEEGKELYLYKTLNDCIAKAETLLSMTTSEAATIRIAARLKSVQVGYSYRDRALQAFGEIKQLVA
jgi:spore maturation protein CgeB